jgi:tetratricopeptide (TPR) repeat protein
MRYVALLFFLLWSCGASGANADDLAARAASQIQSGDFKSAAETLRPLVAHSPSRSDLWNLLGVCESELNNPAAAKEAFEKGLALDPQSVSLNENLGNLLYREGDYDRAKKVLVRAIALGSANPGVAFSLAASRVRTGEQRQGLALLKDLETALADQHEYWAERGWVELPDDAAAAATSFDRAITLAPEDVRALNGAASAAEAQKDDEKAISYLLLARKAQPDDIRILLHFGSICLRRDLTIDALDAIERAYKLAPSNNLALFLYARVQIAFQQWQQSHNLFIEFDRRVPNYAPTQYALGWLDKKLNRTAEAREHLEKSLALEGTNADALYELGDLELNEGRLDAAEKALSAALQRAPNHAKASIALGDIILRRGDLTGAKARYEAAIAADANSGPAHYKLSTVFMRLHENERAEQERTIGARLNADATKASKTVLVLSDPDGRLLSGVKTKAEQ